jgi:hypothetical protein
VDKILALIVLRMYSNISCLDGSFLEYLPMVQGVWGSIPGRDKSVQIALDEDGDIFGQDSL